MLELFTEDVLFGIVLTFVAYFIGVRLNRLCKTPLVHPILVAVIVVIAVLALLQIPYDTYLLGGSVINIFLAPITAVLAYSIYLQRGPLGEYFVPIVLGCLAGAIASMGSVYLLCRLFDLDAALTTSLIPKSVSTPIAMEISRQLGGIPSITVGAVTLTGIFGAMTAPLVVRVLRIKNPVAKGVGIGCSSHAVGTSKALEMGDVEGAMSGISIGISGILTVLITLFF